MGKLAKAYKERLERESRCATHKTETWLKSLSEYDQQLVREGWYGVPKSLRWNLHNRIFKNK